MGDGIWLWRLRGGGGGGCGCSEFFPSAACGTEVLDFETLFLEREEKGRRERLGKRRHGKTS